MNVEEKKQERSKAKMAVTVASRRLIGAANRDSEYEILKSLMIELEKVFDDFCMFNEEYEIVVSDEQYAEHRVVNGEDIKTYRESVSQNYQEARNVFVQAKANNQQIINNQAAGPVKSALKNDFSRIHELITVIDKNFEFENLNPQALQLDKSDLQSVLNVICDNMTKLGSIETSEQNSSLQKEIDVIVGMVYNRVRKINLYLHECQNSTKTTASSSGKFNASAVLNNNTLHASSNSLAHEMSKINVSPTNIVPSVVESFSPVTPVSPVTPATTTIENSPASQNLVEPSSSDSLNTNASTFVPSAIPVSVHPVVTSTSEIVNVNLPTANVSDANGSLFLPNA